MHLPRRHFSHLILAVAALGVALPAAPVLAANWGGERVQGNGNIKKQARELGHFDGVSMALAGNVEVHTGSTESVTIETDDNILPLIETAIENGTLKIRPVRRNLNLDMRTLRIVVQARSVERLALGGSGSLDVDALRGGHMQIDLGGSGTINVKSVDGDALAVTLGGSGNLKAGGGNAKTLSVSIGGSGDVMIGQVKTGDASVNIAGSGKATIAVRDSLSATIAGSGDVEFYGDPKVSKTVIGSGGTRRLGSLPR